jgi:hypothetical protein
MTPNPVRLAHHQRLLKEAGEQEAMAWSPEDLRTGPGPPGPLPDLAGPTVYSMADLMRGYPRASGKRRLLIPVRMPGQAGRAYRAADNLTLDGATIGTRTWEAFLAERIPMPRW